MLKQKTKQKTRQKKEQEDDGVFAQWLWFMLVKSTYSISNTYPTKTVSFFSVFVTTYQIQALEKVIHTLWHAIIQWCCCFWLHISYPFAHCMRCGLLFLTPHSNSLFEFHSLDQEGKGGYRHPRREFMGDSDFGQARCADFENQCYTGN